MLQNYPVYKAQIQSQEPRVSEFNTKHYIKHKDDTEILWIFIRNIGNNIVIVKCDIRWVLV